MSGNTCLFFAILLNLVLLLCTLLDSVLPLLQCPPCNYTRGQRVARGIDVGLTAMTVVLVITGLFLVSNDVTRLY